MQRRVVLKGLAALPLSLLLPPRWRCCAAGPRCPARRARLARPSGVGQAPQERWRASGEGARSPFAACTPHPGSPGCTELFQNLRDPFYIGDSVA